MQKIVILFLVSVAMLAGPAGRADEVYTFVVKKQEEKAKSRWTLSEWLETRDKIRLMDLWLAMHSPSPYEFFIDGAYRFASAPGTGILNASRFGFGAYASLVGIELERQGSERTETTGLLSLRIFGHHVQSTHIALQGGLRMVSGGSSFRNAMAGGRMAIYLTRYFGVDGSFHHLFQSTPFVDGAIGNQWRAGAFIDFRFLRVYGEYFGSSESSVRNGTGLGMKLFF